MRFQALLLALPLALSCIVPAHAAEQSNCIGFAWPLDTELAWMASGESVALQSGEELSPPPAKAIVLALKPAKSVTMPRQQPGHRLR